MSLYHAAYERFIKLADSIEKSLKSDTKDKNQAETQLQMKGIKSSSDALNLTLEKLTGVIENVSSLKAKTNTEQQFKVEL